MIKTIIYYAVLTALVGFFIFALLGFDVFVCAYGMCICIALIGLVSTIKPRSRRTKDQVISDVLRRYETY